MKLRPPGAQAESQFIASCIRCGKCAQVCPYRSIKIASILDGLTMMGTPFIRAREVPCYLCMKCPPVCPSGALDRKLRQKQDVRMGSAIIDKNACLPWQGTLCRSCYENCPIFDEAIVLDGELRPVVDKNKCIGCGICENVCPVERAAITVKPRGNR
ncbi:MAG TPA: 4Fe-4S dicluster domain-containing protein [Dissulfurispiraceae bacterium]|nr:4Fe-4S dicluster domain-containing protein [Dissulfurispiraceae bacterium]